MSYIQDLLLLSPIVLWGCHSPIADEAASRNKVLQAGLMAVL